MAMKHNPHVCASSMYQTTMPNTKAHAAYCAHEMSKIVIILTKIMIMYSPNYNYAYRAAGGKSTQLNYQTV